jgi:sigma-B regulation protein RsbU (phosphoserine phosphatase)
MITHQLQAGADTGQFDAVSLMPVLEVSRRLGGQFELHELLAAIVDAGRNVLYADRGTVFLYDPEPRELYAEVATGVQELRFSIDQGIAGECARDRKIINVPDCYADPRHNRAVDLKTGYRTNNMLTIPLVGLENKLVGVLQLLNSAKGQFDATDEQVAMVLASQAAAAIQHTRLIEEHMVKLQLEHDLDLARDIQASLLPTNIQAPEGYSLAAFNRPADQTGGDFYDVISLPKTLEHSGEAERMLLVLADVTGHGIGPALIATQVRTMVRLGLRLCNDLEKLFLDINNQLKDDLDSNRFVTAFFGVLDAGEHTVRYHSAGQAPLLHYHANTGSCELRGASTVPMGIIASPPMDHVEPMRMAPGDVIALLTDGFYEHPNPAEEQFGEDRVGQVIHEHAGDSAQAIFEALLAAFTAHIEDVVQNDDLTALILKRNV